MDFGDKIKKWLKKEDQTPKEEPIKEQLPQEKSEQKKRTAMCLSIPLEIRDAMDAIAQQRGMTRSDVAREALGKFIKSHLRNQRRKLRSLVPRTGGC